MLQSTNSEYLEQLSDEEFFSRRFTLNEEDKKELLKSSVLVDGHRYYRAKVKEKILRKYAEMTNPKPGEPGTRENPLVRFGKQYIYNETGDLVEYITHTVRYILQPHVKPTVEQRRMAIKAGHSPIIYDVDCPELSEDTLKSIMEMGHKRKRERIESVK